MQDVHADKVEASYTGGMLQVVIPKKQLQREYSNQSSPWGNRMGQYGRPHNQSSFFDDRDFFW